MKLLFFLDFRHFKETGKSVTGLEYFAWEKGPVPKDLFEEIECMKPDLKKAVKIVSHEGGLQEIRAQRAFNEEFFTKREMRLLY